MRRALLGGNRDPNPPSKGRFTCLEVDHQSDEAMQCVVCRNSRLMSTFGEKVNWWVIASWFTSTKLETDHTDKLGIPKSGHEPLEGLLRRGAPLGGHAAAHASASPQLSFSVASANPAILHVETHRHNLSGGILCLARVSH